jgi:mono/diheme cytochrome c family protein
MQPHSSESGALPLISRLPRGWVLRLGATAAVGPLMVVWLAAVAVQAQRASASAGVYTRAQAGRGQALYEQQCTDCHQKDLSGGDRGPALAGDSFLQAWVDLSVADLFTRIRTSMPVESPGSLTPQATSDIVAFLLQANDYPAGASELASDTTVLETIAIDRAK